MDKRMGFDKMVIVAALYKFTELRDTAPLQASLMKLCRINGIFGTLLLAPEGINGTIAGSRSGIDAIRDFLKGDGRFIGMEYKESVAQKNPFHRMKVKIKDEIVTMGQSDADPSRIMGTYVDAKQWNQLLEDPEVLVLDVRNRYETAIGSFENALDPMTDSFREFPKFVKENLDPRVHKKIAMSCTGGIRCEKASSYMKSQGFREVYHLKGGVLKYLESTPKEQSKWSGECFVFDQRVSVDHELRKGSYDMCFGCRRPISESDKKNLKYEEGICCPKCSDDRSEGQRRSAQERHRQVLLGEIRGQQHLGFLKEVS